MHALRRLVAWLTCVLTAPVRLFRQRTMIQLMVSHVAVVLISYLLLNIIAVAVIVGWVPGRSLAGLDEVSQDPFLGERARSYAIWLDAGAIIDQYGDLETPDARKVLARRLQTIAAHEVPGFARVHPPGGGVSDMLAFGVPRAAFLVDPGGTIITSTDRSLGVPGAELTTVQASAARNAAVQALAGAPASGPGLASAVNMDAEVTGAAAPVLTDDGAVVAWLVLQGYPLPHLVGDSGQSLLRETVVTVLRTSWVYMVPAMLVALPFAYWQSRSASLRLERLAHLADAFAEGDLHPRVRVTRRDEVGRLAERFNEMGGRIEAEARSRRAFLSNVSHELRTPVAVIQATLERLTTAPDTTPAQTGEAISLVSLEVHNLTRLIDDLSTLGRLEEAKLRLEPRRIDVCCIVSDAVNGLKQMAWHQRKVSMENLVPPDLPPAFADPGRLLQVVHNLLFNALRHTPEGGLVVVQAALASDAMELAVRDTGVGIPPERLEQVFDRYYQVERPQRGAEGSGLGLYIVQQLVQAQGGDITVESVVDQGTTFRLTVPLATRSTDRAIARQRDEETL